MDKKKALLYARVSTNHQVTTGHSLDSQAALLAKRAESEGYQVEVILESGSGRRVNRPKLTEALDRLNRGEADALFALDIDRLARSTLHLLQISETAKKKGWRLVIDSLNIDTENINDKLQLTILAAFAEFERDLISQRIKRQHEARRQRGIVWGVDQGPKGNLDPGARKLIVSERAKGKSLRAIAATLVSKGLKTPKGGQWHAMTVLDILNSPQSKELVKGKA